MAKNEAFDITIGDVPTGIKGLPLPKLVMADRKDLIGRHDFGPDAGGGPIRSREEQAVSTKNVVDSLAQRGAWEPDSILTVVAHGKKFVVIRGESRNEAVQQLTPEAYKQLLPNGVPCRVYDKLTPVQIALLRQDQQKVGKQTEFTTRSRFVSALQIFRANRGISPTALAVAVGVGTDKTGAPQRGAVQSTYGWCSVLADKSRSKMEAAYLAFRALIDLKRVVSNEADRAKKQAEYEALAGGLRDADWKANADVTIDGSKMLGLYGADEFDGRAMKNDNGHKIGPRLGTEYEFCFNRDKQEAGPKNPVNTKRFKEIRHTMPAFQKAAFELASGELDDNETEKTEVTRKLEIAPDAVLLYDYQRATMGQKRFDTELAAARKWDAEGRDKADVKQTANKPAKAKAGK